MEPLSLLIVLLSLFILTNFWLMPVTRDSWKSAKISRQVAKAGILAVLEKIRDLSLIGTLSIVVIMIVVAACGVVSNSDYSASKNIIESLSGLYDVLKDISSGYATFLLWFGLAGTFIVLTITAKKAKNRIIDAWKKQANIVFDRITTDFSELERLQNSPEYKDITTRIIEIYLFLHAEESESERNELSPEELEALNQELNHLITSLSFLKAEEELDIEESLKSPAASEEQEKESKGKKILGILASKQLLKDLGVVSKPLSFLLTALLLVSLTGWAATPMANSLQLTLNNLRIQAIAEDVQRELNQAISDIPDIPEIPSNENEPNDSSAVANAARIIARLSANELMRSGMLQRTAGYQQSALSESEFVRAAVNQQEYIADRTIPREVNEARREVADDIKLNAKNSSDLSEKISRQIEPELNSELQKIRKKNPSFFSQIAKNAQARYATSMSPLDVQGQLIGRIVDQGFSSVSSNSNSELAKQGNKLVKTFGKKAVTTWANTYAKNVVTEMLMDQARSEVSRQMNQTYRFNTTESSERFIRSLVEAESRGWQNIKSQQAESAINKKVASNLASKYPNDPAARAAIMRNLGGYSELFPAASEPFSGGGGGGGGAGSSSSEKNKKYVRSRATSFKLASVSSKVRGVLFGQEFPENTLSIQDIEWKVVSGTGKGATNVEIILNSENETIAIGEFPAAVVNQALRFAADQRVVATTITPGDGQIISRVTYLHPVLLDTPLGCRIIESDRFIDSFTFEYPNSPVDKRLKTLSNDRVAMGGLTQMLNYAEFIAIKVGYEKCPREQVQQDVDEFNMGELRFSEAMEMTIDQFLVDKEVNSQGSTTFIKSVLECGSGLRKDVGNCLCDSIEKTRLPYDYWFIEDHTSQFREAEIKSAKDLSWIKQSVDRLSHIDFWVHATLSVRKRSHSLEPGEPDESTSRAIDFPESHLSTLKSVLRGGTLTPFLTNQLNSPSYDDFMQPIEEFLLLQRLMRAAFSGKLGKNFPIHKLIQLERDTRKYVPFQPTMRWEANPRSEEQFVDVIKGAGEGAVERYIKFEQDRVTRVRSNRPICDRVSL